MAEVFLTDAVELMEHRFLVGAQWPRDHALYHPDASGTSDPLLLAETIRQALVFLAHRYYGVPLGHWFIGQVFDLEITDVGALRVAGEPMSVVIDARWSWLVNRPPHRFGMRLDIKAAVAGRPLGRGGLTSLAVGDSLYTLLRRRGRDGRTPSAAPQARFARVSPGRVGRLRAKDSVLIPRLATDRWGLWLDREHAILFDHPLDHAPLMAQLEGVRQLGYLLAHPARGRTPRRTLISAHARFHAFAELDLALDLVVREHEPAAGRLAIDIVQDGSAVTTSTTVWSG